jgi:hypothetical protein
MAHGTRRANARQEHLQSLTRTGSHDVHAHADVERLLSRPFGQTGAVCVFGMGDLAELSPLTLDRERRDLRQHPDGPADQRPWDDHKSDGQDRGQAIVLIWRSVHRFQPPPGVFQ